MITTEKLKLLELATNFTIKRVEEGYEVSSRDNTLAAVISPNGYVDYYITGVKNIISGYVQIHPEDVIALRDFVEELVK